MPRRVKDEERVEMIIRDLLKLPENRRCVNCNSLGPQYVCTTFCTFICTICSGVHREFTHRVKSVSMAKFSEEEIAALQAGGNERAREIYFKAWDPERDSYPDASKLRKLREFIEHVYVDRKYAGENKRASIVKSNSATYSNRRSDDKFDFAFSDRRSNSSREDLGERGSVDQPSPFRRSGGITFRDIMEERSPRGGQRNRPATRFEIVDDRFRDDGSVKRYEHRSGARSPVSQTTAPNLGEKVPPLLTIEGPPKYCEKKNAADAAVPVLTRKQNETVYLNSLIDFDAKPEPADNPSPPQEAITTSQNMNNEISSVASQANQRTPDAPDKNSLESLLFDMSGPLTSSDGTSQISTAAQLDSYKATDGAPSAHIAPNEDPLNDSSKDLTVQVTQVHAQQSGVYGEAFYNHQSNKSPTSNDLALVPIVPLKQSSQVTDQEDGSKAIVRKEIPQDMFSSDFASFTRTAGGWQMHPPYGTSYGMQFRPTAMPVAAFPNPSRPSNPFDIGEDGFHAQAPMYPSNMAASTAFPAQSSPYARTMSPHMSPYGMNMPQVHGAYMGQLPNNRPLTRPQVDDANTAKGGDAFAYPNPVNQTSGSNFSSSAPNSSLSRTGNPFG